MPCTMSMRCHLSISIARSWLTWTTDESMPVVWAVVIRTGVIGVVEVLPCRLQLTADFEAMFGLW
jgi:hypothetical protein